MNLIPTQRPKNPRSQLAAPEPAGAKVRDCVVLRVCMCDCASIAEDDRMGRMTSSKAHVSASPSIELLEARGLPAEAKV